MTAAQHVLIAGAGYAGSIVAERLASAGVRVTIVERRSHIAGNAYDARDANGVLVHRYGPHIFHTNSPKVVEYLSRFTEWRPYEHRVLANIGGRTFPFPINLDTLEQFFGVSVDAQSAEALLARLRDPRDPVRTSEDVVVNAVGHELYEAFFRGYTRKQWGLDPAELSASVAARIPFRTNRDDRYFTDSFQNMPKEGYTRMFERILDHPLITVRLNTDFQAVEGDIARDHTVYTGPIDAYFGCRFGALPYRSLRFEHDHLPETEFLQPVAQVNYPGDEPYTRITEFKHLTGQQCAGTTVAREYPEAEGEPYYPVPRPENEALYQRYRALADAEPDVTFVGRLAQYRYYNMDQVAAAALVASERILERLAIAKPTELTA